VVRLKTSFWKDKRGGIHIKKSLIPLKLQSEGYQILQEDADNFGIDEIVDRIVNLFEVKDGVYSIEMINLSHDWETGYLESYDYQLNPLKEEKNSLTRAFNDLS
jgi:hypothetical protein